MLQTCPEATGTPWPVLAFAEEPEYVPIDANGNLTADGAKSYEWDAENRLTAINHHGTQRSEFKYDGLGRRVEIIERDNCSAETCTTLTSDKKYLWVGSSIAEERNDTGGTGATVTKRFFGQGFQQGGNNYFYTKDHLGSIREVVDATGTLKARYDYDSYGRRTKDISIQNPVDADFGYTGYFHHAPSGLDLALYRAYDPNLGRWISRDPIGLDGGLNLYAYAEEDPINNTDALGLDIDIQEGWWGGYSCDEARRVRHKLDRIRSTTRGKEILDALENDHSRHLKIRPPVFWWPAKARNFYDPRTDTVYFDLDMNLLYYTQKGIQRSGGAERLGHELGHACGTKSEGMNVNFNENAIADELGQAIRSNYRVPDDPLYNVHPKYETHPGEPY